MAIDLDDDSVTTSVEVDLKRHGRSKVTNGSALLPGVDGRSVWVRRCRDVLHEHLADLGGEGNTSVAERSIIRRAAVLTTELERMETRFALADQAAVDPDAIDLYGRSASTLRRLLESVGLQRRAKDVTDGAMTQRIMSYIDEEPA